MKPTHLSLFSGIGGMDLAAEWAGFETVGQCEWADFPTKVLEKHWPDVPRWRDIRSVTRESFTERTGLRTVDIISGGFPCQPFSVAGKQKGKGDNRYLWPEMLRVIREIKPGCVIGENVPGILRIAGRTVCEELEREGYSVAVFNFEAAAVGAKHRRERVFFVGHSESEQSTPRNQREFSTEEQRKFRRGCCEGGIFSDTDNTTSTRQREYCEKRRSAESELGRVVDGISEWLDGYWRLEPDIPRVATGIKNRVERLKALGNAVVPQQVYPLFMAIYLVITEERRTIK